MARRLKVKPRHQIAVNTQTPPDDAGPGSPKLPHERDESVGVTGGIQNDHVQQASRDVERGLVDTSRAPEADATYHRLRR